MNKNLIRLVSIWGVLLLALLPMYIKPVQAAPNVSGTGKWECWDDGNGNPCRYDLYGLDFVTSNEGWAVGESGIIRKYNGTKWVDFTSPITTTLYSVDMISSSLGWAVGSSGVILQWNGANWTKVTSPTTTYIQDIKMISSTDGWAVGGYYQSGSRIILRWNGTSWSDIAKPAGRGLMALDIVNANDIWAVGYDQTSVLHWNGSQWQTVVTPLTATNTFLADIDMLSASDGWAVGYDGTIIRWNGTSWQSIASPLTYADFNGIFMVSATDGWIIAKDTFLHWNGSEWIDTDPDYVLYAGPAWPRDIQMVTATDGWIVSESGEIWHWNGTVWQRQTRSASGLQAVAMSSMNNGFAVGGWPDYVALRWDGQTWVNTAVPIETQTVYSPVMPNAVNGGGGLYFNDVDTMSSTSAWAVANTGPMKWDGQKWITTTIPTTDYTNLVGVDMLSDSDVWAVSEGEYYDENRNINGDIFHWNGNAWNLITNIPASGLNDVKMLNANSGWIVGSGGAILRWNGSSWLSVTSPVTTTLRSVDVISSTFAVAVGYEGNIVKWDGVSWSKMASSTTSHLLSVDIVSPTDIWIASNVGILHWDGISWQNTYTRPYSVLAINMVDTYEGWATGVGGLILHYTAPRPTISSNYSTGAPGSYFTVTGTNFPANSLVHIFINSHELGTVTSDVSGGFVVILNTTGADTGQYKVTATVNPSAETWFSLDSSQPIRPQVGSGTVITVPAGIAWKLIYLPLVIR